MKQISFDVSHLTSLMDIDLANNAIEILDTFSLNNLNQLYDAQHKRLKAEENNTVKINLLGNPFSCSSCMSLAFVEWFVKSPMFSTTRTFYHCQTGHGDVPMDDSAINASDEECERPKRILRAVLLGTILPTIAIAFVVFLTVVFKKKHKKEIIHQEFEERVRLLKDEKIRFRFPVFLSYSSEDGHLVLANVLPPLQVWH